VCNLETLQKFQDYIPDGITWLDAKQAMESNFQPFDVALLNINRPDPTDKIYTIFLTSGTTGKPKQIPETCRAFREHNIIQRHQ
jgi:long-subunit acyl-CoA synthetase (AMP-forming)